MLPPTQDRGPQCQQLEKSAGIPACREQVHSQFARHDTGTLLNLHRAWQEPHRVVGFTITRDHAINAIVMPSRTIRHTRCLHPEARHWGTADKVSHRNDSAERMKCLTSAALLSHPERLGVHRTRAHTRFRSRHLVGRDGLQKPFSVLRRRDSRLRPNMRSGVCEPFGEALADGHGSRKQNQKACPGRRRPQSWGYVAIHAWPKIPNIVIAV